MFRGRSVMKAAPSKTGRLSKHTGVLGNDTAEQPSSESFIVRVYRIDTQDDEKIGGLVETLDGSGVSESFTRIDELGAILKRRVLSRDSAGRSRAKRNDKIKGSR